MEVTIDGEDAEWKGRFTEGHVWCRGTTLTLLPPARSMNVLFDSIEITEEREPLLRLERPHDLLHRLKGLPVSDEREVPSITAFSQWYQIVRQAEDGLPAVDKNNMDDYVVLHDNYQPADSETLALIPRKVLPALLEELENVVKLFEDGNVVFQCV